MNETRFSVLPTDVVLQDVPLTWGVVVEGEPQVRCSVLWRSEDELALTILCDFTPGSFSSFNDVEQTFYVLEGDVTLTDAFGPRTVRPGEIAYIPTGSDVTWRIEHYVKKLVFLRMSVPRFLGRTIRAVRRSQLRASGNKPPRNSLYEAVSAMALADDPHQEHH